MENLSEKNLRKKYWQYIIPSIIAQVVFTLYTMVDALMVARGVSASALAAVNISLPFLSVLWAIAIIFAVGTSTIIARLMGEGHGEHADRVFSQTCAVLAVFSVVVSALTYLGTGAIADFLGATDNTRGYVITYIRTIAPFSLGVILSYVFEILMPVDGHPRLASIVVTASVIANFILDYLLIFVFKLGVWGAAFATGLSQSLAALVFLVHFLSRKSNIKFCSFTMDWKLILQELWRGLPAGASDISPGLTVFVMVKFIGAYIGEEGLIAFSATEYVSLIILSVAIAFGQGSQPLISYYNGAKRRDLISRIVKYEFKDATIVGVLMFAAIFAGTPLIINIFIKNESPELIAYAIRVMRKYITFGLIAAYSIILSNYATAMEKPMNGVLIALLRTTVFLVAGILIMKQIMGAEGIWFGMTVAEVLTLILAIILTKVQVPLKIC